MEVGTTPDPVKTLDSFFVKKSYNGKYVRLNYIDTMLKINRAWRVVWMWINTIDKGTKEAIKALAKQQAMHRDYRLDDIQQLYTYCQADQRLYKELNFCEDFVVPDYRNFEIFRERIYYIEGLLHLTMVFKPLYDKQEPSK